MHLRSSYYRLYQWTHHHCCYHVKLEVVLCAVLVRLNRDALRTAYVSPPSSTSMAHGSSGPMPLQLPMYRSQHQPPDPAPVTGLLGGQPPSSNLSAPVYGVPVHGAYKRPAMLSSEYGQSSSRRALLEPLKIDTELKKVLTYVLVIYSSFLHLYDITDAVDYLIYIYIYWLLCLLHCSGFLS